MSRILVGTASWTDRTLLESGWYPPEATTPERRLAYYASQFPLVEVDSTYYTPPNERNSHLWASRTPEGFTFDVKAYSLLTRHPTRRASLYRDLRPEGDKATVYVDDLAPALVDQVWERFLSALQPLDDAGRLGCLLFQFPPWFAISRRNKHYLLECARRCAPYRMCVELRHASWLSEDNRAETLDFLTSYALPYVVVDMPQGHPSSVPPVVAATGPVSVVRFHGHSSRWDSTDIYERFGYRYEVDELRPWVPRIEQLASQVDEVHVVTNNCYRDYAQTNAKQLADLLRRTPQPT